MIIDISMAFFAALLINTLSFMSQIFKQIMVIVSCITIICAYFFNGCQLNFIGEIDMSIWIIFIILFDKMVVFAMNKCEKSKLLNELFNEPQETEKTI